MSTKGMENLKLHIEERLWNFIKRNYNSENYTNAILDAIQFIGDIVREKAGLESDGNQLIGAAFGGENPKMKLNHLRTDSEKNFQKGIESILRGVYSAYRNPRSHSKVEDSEVDAFEVITFLNHLLKIIDKSTGKFSTELFLKRILDDDFVQTKKYAELLIKEIPSTKLFEIAIEIYRAKENGKIHNLKFIWDELILLLTDEQNQELHNMVSEELRYTDSLATLTRCIALFQNSWEYIDEDARLRAENKIIKALSNAERNIHGSLNESAIFGTWFTPILRKSILKEGIAEKIFELLDSGNESKQRYAIDYFSRYFDELEPLLIFSSYKDVFKNELEKGNGVIHAYVLRKYKGEEREEFKTLLENFSLVSNDDDLPF